eukprot:Anaeramoba_flamelloidesa327133_37.p1 GENE.a327133_37~~a327133_37.p1  ORF type:complete len:310 (+),score=96.10 a327133_37:369-1298(+)
MKKLKNGIQKLKDYFYLDKTFPKDRKKMKNDHDISKLTIGINLMTNSIFITSVEFSEKYQKGYEALLLQIFKNKNGKKIALLCLSNYLENFLKRFSKIKDPEYIKNFLNGIFDKWINLNNEKIFGGQMGGIITKIITIVSKWNPEYCINNIIIKLFETKKNNLFNIERMTFGFLILKKLLKKQDSYEDGFIDEETNVKIENEILINIENSIEKILDSVDQNVGNYLLSNIHDEKIKKNYLMEKESPKNQLHYQANLNFLIGFIKILPNLFPSPLSTLHKLIKYTIHVNEELSSVSLAALKKNIGGQRFN